MIIKTEEEVIALLQNADDAYYNSESPILTDDQYDELKEYAQTKFPKNSYFKSVGAPVPEKSQKVKHDYVLGSLKKFKPDNIDKWLKKYPSDKLCVIMPKLDGASLFVRYENGELVKATTRGDGFSGFDLTHKAKKFLPKKIKNKGIVDLRAECLLKKSAFAALGFSNARNGVSGLLNKDGVEHCEKIDCLFYEYINSPNDSLIQDFNDMNEMGLNVVDYHLLSDFDVNDLKQILTSLKIDYDYDLDGLVLAHIDYARENVERPEHKIAFKVNSDGIEAIIDRVEWNVSRTGRLVPIAIFKNPIPIDGSNVSKATGHNAQYIKENKINTGAVVKVLKSGDIIPQIVEVTIPAAKVELPTICPSCNTEVTMVGVDVICQNKKCPDKMIGIMDHFFRTLGVENVSAQTFRNLNVFDLDTVFTLTENDISGLDGFGEKKAFVIVDEIHNCIKNVKPEILLAAVGIPTFGRRNAKKFIDSLDNTLTSKEKFEEIFRLNENMFTSISGFGISIFNSVINNLDTINYVYTVCERHGLTFNEETLSEGNNDAVKVTLTGKGPLPRKELEKILKDRGYDVIDFTSETKILVCDDLNSSSSKMKKAKKNNVKIVTYEEFI